MTRAGARPGPALRADGRIGVVTLIDHLVHGGAERLAVDIATGVDPERFASTLCVSRRSAPADDATRALRAQAEAAGVPVLTLRRRGLWDAPSWRPLLRLLSGGDVQVLHAHKFGSNVWGALLGSAARVPVVIAHEHSWAVTADRRRDLLSRHVVSRGADVVIACSREDRRRLVEDQGHAPSAVRFIPNGIRSRPPDPSRDVRAELGIAPGAPVVGSVAALRPEKRLDVLLRATSELAAARPEIRIVLVGDGPERPALEALARELGLEARLLILGARSDVPDLLAAFDVAVTCSDFEGSPLSVMEYMEAGLPVVASAVGGLPDLLDDGACGVLVPRRYPAALAAALDRLLGDLEVRTALGEAARRRRREEFDLGVMIGRIERLYEQLHEASLGRTAQVA